MNPQARAQPGEVLLVSAADGGYDPVTGFDPAARGPVPGSPSIDLPATRTGTEDPYEPDSPSVAQPTGCGSTSTARTRGTRPRPCCP